MRFLRLAVVVVLLFGFSSPVAAAGPCAAPVQVVRVLKLPLNTGEASGFVASIRYPRVGWIVRDSGHPAHLYAMSLPSGGKPEVREIRVPGASNRDWEDISYRLGPDGRGRLWVVESGQSGGDRWIYEILEPDPWRDREAKLLGRYRYRYPDGNVNTEASFFFWDRLVLVTKTAPARFYVFPGPLSRRWVNVPVLRETLPRAGLVSVARLSPGKDLLVTSTHEVLRVYRWGQPLGSLPEISGGAQMRRRPYAARENVEAGDFFPAGRCKFLVISERRNSYRLHHP